MGQQVSSRDHMDKEIAGKISRGWKNYLSLKEIYKSEIPIEEKVKILESCTFPAMTYYIAVSYTHLTLPTIYSV